MKPVYQKALRLLFLLLIINAIGAIGGMFVTEDALNWMNSLHQPPFMPPDIAFAVVWPVIYVLAAIAGFLTWGKTSPRWYVLFLAGVLIWPFVFFKFRALSAAFALTAFIVFALGRCIYAFYRVSKPAAWLLAPVMGWCVFALYLGGWLWLKN